MTVLYMFRCVRSMRHLVQCTMYSQPQAGAEVDSWTYETLSVCVYIERAEIMYEYSNTVTMYVYMYMYMERICVYR